MLVKSEIIKQDKSHGGEHDKELHNCYSLTSKFTVFLDSQNEK